MHGKLLLHTETDLSLAIGKRRKGVPHPVEFDSPLCPLEQLAAEIATAARKCNALSVKLQPILQLIMQDRNPRA